MNFFVYSMLFIVGTLFGSFGSVLLTRLHNMKNKKHFGQILSSILRGRSHCPGCQRTLSRKELIPLRSFFVQQGKCRHCSYKLDWLYPTLEIVSGGLFVLVYIFVGSWSGELVVRSLIFWLLGLLAVWDIKTQHLHFPLRVLIVIVVFLQVMIGGNIWWIHLVSGGVLMLSSYSIYLLGRRYATQKYGTSSEGFGMGDVLLSLPLGILLPYCSATVVRPVFFSSYRIVEYSLLVVYFFTFASILGIVFAGCSRLVQRYLLSSARPSISFIPFFPAMAIAFFFLLFFGGFLKI